MEKYSRLFALILASLNLIATAVFGLFLILSVYPLGSMLSDTQGKIFFVCGLIFFWLTMKTVNCLRGTNQFGYNLLAGHFLVMLFGILYFDWIFIVYLPIIVTYALPLLVNVYCQKHNKALNTDSAKSAAPVS